MITRKKGILIVSGTEKEMVLRILGNHEALVKVTDSSTSIQYIWSKNKTPLLDEKDVFRVCGKAYEGVMLVFDTDEHGINENTQQEEVSSIVTEFCYGHKIEPGEFRVANTANNSADGCFFCDICNHPSETTVEYNKKAKFVDMVIYETENFVVVPGMGPLMPGYLMIMPKEHYLSLAQVPEELYQEYNEVEQDIEAIIKGLYGLETGFYEHGTKRTGATGLKSIVHAHVHIMPGANLEEEYRCMVNMHRVSNIKIAGDQAYFSYKWGSAGDIWLTMDEETYIQRQFHRQVYAEKQNFAKDQFNWRKTEFAENTKTCVWQLYDYLKSERNHRIVQRTRAFVEAARQRF